MSFQAAYKQLRKQFNNCLDKLVRPEMNILHRSRSSFHVCGYTGLVFAIMLAITLVVYLGLSQWLIIGIIGIAMLTFLGLAMATKIITAEEQLIYYHHEIAIIIMAAIFLRILNQPVLPYLDLTILGIGIFLACGRVGCLMVGCCHGRSHKWGVCYRKEHADAGFTHYYVGVRLFPIQAVESIWVLFVVIVGVMFILRKQPPGEVLAWYIVTYSAGRFCLEFLRGDAERPYIWGFSEAQWTSILLMSGVVLAGFTGVIPFHIWHLAVTSGMIILMIIVTLHRHLSQTDQYRLLHPRHVKEVAETIDKISQLTEEKKSPRSIIDEPVVVPIGTTSLGIQISSGKIQDKGRYIDHYALSSQNEKMSQKTADILADLIIKFKHTLCLKELVTQNRGVFHLLIRPLNAGGQK